MNNIIQNKLNELREEKKKIENQINKISHSLFADYLNNEFNLNKYKSKLYYGENCINFPWQLANRIHQWIYDHNIELKDYNFSGVYVKVFDDHYAAVQISFENKAIQNDFIKNFKVTQIS